MLVLPLHISKLFERMNEVLLNTLCILLALGSFSTVFGEEWKEKTDRDFVKVTPVRCELLRLYVAEPAYSLPTVLTHAVSISVIYNVPIYMFFPRMSGELCSNFWF